MILLLLPTGRAIAESSGPLLDTSGVASGNDATLSVMAALTVPPQGGSLGGKLAVDARYGVPLGPVVLSGGARVEAGWARSLLQYAVLPTLRLSVPFSLVSCFAFGGFGYGRRLRPASDELAIDAGVGMVVPLSDSFAFGGEASYFQLVGENVRLVSFGPTLTYRP